MSDKPELTHEQDQRIYKGLERVAEFCLMLLVGGDHLDLVFKEYAASIVAASDSSSWGDEVYHLAATDVAERYEKMAASRGTKGWPRGSEDHRDPLRTLEAPFAREQKLAEVCGALYRAGSILIAVKNDLYYGDKTVTPEDALRFAEEKVMFAKASLVTIGYMQV